MKKITENAARALFKTDETINPMLVDPAFDVLRGRTAAGLILGPGLESVVSRRKASELLGVSAKTVDRYCREGLLKGVKGSGARRIGVLSSSIREFTGREVMR